VTASTQVHKHAVVLLFGLMMGGTARAPEPAKTQGNPIQADTSLKATIRRHIRGLVFDSVLGAADAQPLLIREGRRSGYAKIEPEVNAYRGTLDSLALGRIIARISSESAYAPLHLGPGINWWWVDRKGDTWRSTVYSEALNTTYTTDLDSLRSHPGYEWKQSIARFVVLDTIVAMWGVYDRRCVPAIRLTALYQFLERATPWATPKGPGKM
jgi:hypothetical protein